MRIKISYLFVFLISSLLNGQTAIEEYKKTIDVYKNAKEFSFDVDVYAYESKTDKSPQPIGKGTARKKDNLYLTKFMETEVLHCSEGTIVVNHDKHLIDFFEYDYNKRMDEVKSGMVNLLDSSLSKVDSSLVFLGTREGLKCFSISNPGAIIEKTDIFVNPTTNMISKLVYYYGSSTEDYELGVAVVIIYYKNSSLKVNSNENLKSSRYITKSGSGYLAVPTLKNYKVICHKDKKTS